MQHVPLKHFGKFNNITPLKTSLKNILANLMISLLEIDKCINTNTNIDVNFRLKTTLFRRLIWKINYGLIYLANNTSFSFIKHLFNYSLKMAISRLAI